jgi:hypoxanthine phosphoribosyltransferase
MNKHIIKFNEFKNHLSKICRNFNNWRPDYVVGLTRGGLLPAVMISHWLDVPMHALGVSLRDNSDLGCESNFWMATDAFEGKNILIVDDINDTGATLNWIMEDWASGCFPNDPKWENVWNNNVRFAVVVDNLASQCKVKMDYCGIEINKAEKDVWIEFPYEDWWTK